MRIPCPFCGSRDLAEFMFRGDAGAEDVCLRDNPAGRLHELWRHAQGCRQWLVVERDTLTHEVFGAILAQDAPR